MIESKYTCDGCGDLITVGGKYPGYSHFELSPIPNVPDGGWVYALGYMHEENRQFCFNCKHTMMDSLPIKYYACGLCARFIKGEKGQTIECLEEKHDKEFHPNYSKVVVGGLSSERSIALDDTKVPEDKVFTFNENSVITKTNCCVDHQATGSTCDHNLENSKFYGESPIEDLPGKDDFMTFGNNPRSFKWKDQNSTKGE